MFCSFTVFPTQIKFHTQSLVTKYFVKGSSRLILPEVMGYSMPGPGYRFISEFRRMPGENTAKPHHDSWCSLISHSNIQNFPIFRAPSTTKLPPFGCGSEPQKSLTPKSCGVTNGDDDNTGAPRHQPTGAHLCLDPSLNLL